MINEKMCLLPEFLPVAHAGEHYGEPSALEYGSPKVMTAEACCCIISIFGFEDGAVRARWRRQTGRGSWTTFVPSLERRC
jgi:hypothetical protein